MAALYSVLTGQSADAVLESVEASREGRLFRCSDAFVDAMADANELLVRLGDKDRERADKNLTAFTAQMSAYDAAWMAAASWPASMVSTRNRLMRLGKARIAREKLQPLFCWYGPRVPEYVVVSGQRSYPTSA
jgi:hypothetical protein